MIIPTLGTLQEENTFAHSLPQFPVRKPGRMLPTFEERGEAPPAYVPAFLPAFPDRHTYVHTPTFPGHEENPDQQTQASACGVTKLCVA
jgi:transcription initiation factor TFIID subunit 8